MSLFGALAEKVRRGEVVERYEQALDGANPTVINTGLKSIKAVSLALKGSAAPGDGTSVLTYDTSGGTLSVYAWKNTGGTDPTLVASTGTETFSAIVIGER